MKIELTKPQIDFILYCMEKGLAEDFINEQYDSLEEEGDVSYYQDELYGLENEVGYFSKCLNQLESLKNK